jgi:hypothetical protein
MTSASDRLRAEDDDRRRRVAAEAIAVVRPLKVVEAHEALEGAMKRSLAGEVGPAEGHAPVLMRDRLLKSLDEAIGPGMPRLGARVADAAGHADLIEGPLELVAAIGEHPLDRHSAFAKTGSRVSRRNAAAAWCVSAGKMTATP